MAYGNASKPTVATECEFSRPAARPMHLQSSQRDSHTALNFNFRRLHTGSFGAEEILQVRAASLLPGSHAVGTGSPFTPPQPELAAIQGCGLLNAGQVVQAVALSNLWPCLIHCMKPKPCLTLAHGHIGSTATFGASVEHCRRVWATRAGPACTILLTQALRLQQRVIYAGGSQSCRRQT